MLDAFWTWLTNSPQDSLIPILVAGLLVGLASGGVEKYWIRLRIVATWVHESGHAMAAIILGRDVTGIRINRDTSGVTHSVGKRSRFQQSIVSFMGYPAPAILGSLLLYLLASAQLHLAIFILILLPILMLLLQRSALGIFLTLVGIVVAGLLAAAPQALATLAVSIFCGYLLVASPRTILELRHFRKRGSAVEGEHSDADTLAALTRVPQSVWEAIFLLASIGLPVGAIMFALR